MADVIVKEILDAGVHFGHRTSRWNPKMRPYIYGRRNLIHIIDIKETIRGILRSQRYLQKVEPGETKSYFSKQEARSLVVNRQHVD